MNRFLEKLKEPIVWGNLLAVVVVTIIVLVCVWFALSAYTLHGESVTVPSVVGCQESDARYILSKMDLESTVVDSSYNKNLPAGCVLEQSPAEGTSVKPGRVVFLTINTERTPTAVVPDIADNSSLREAQARLAAIGFKLGPVEYVNGDKDWVYGVKSRGRQVYAGERVPLDVPLVLQVGSFGAAGMDEESDSTFNAPADSTAFSLDEEFNMDF